MTHAVSNSEIQTWLRCKRKWWLSYGRGFGAKETAFTGALSFGSRIHECMERRAANGEDLLAVWDELSKDILNRQLERDEQIGQRDDEAHTEIRKEYNLGRAMLEGFLDWSEETGFDENYELVAAETIIEAPSGVEGMTLRGKLDQRVRRRSDGALMFRDWKTFNSSNFANGIRTFPMAEQPRFYSLIEWLSAQAEAAKSGETPELTRGGVFTMMKKVLRTGKAQPPFYDEVEVRHNRLARESMWHRTNKRLAEIKEAKEAVDAGGDHRYWMYPIPSQNCAWDCPFVRVCPMMDDSPQESWEAMLRNNYAQYDPNERYSDSPDKKG